MRPSEGVLFDAWIEWVICADRHVPELAHVVERLQPVEVSSAERSARVGAIISQAMSQLGESVQGPVHNHR